MLGLTFFIYGLLIGSFLNVCVYRIPEKMSVIHPRSRCGSCEQTLSAKELIPLISWILLKGRCKNCHSKISIRYPLIEALTGLTFLLVYSVYGLSVNALILCVFSAYLIVVALIDYDHMLIHNKTVLFGIALSALPIVYGYLGHYALYQNATFGFLGGLIPFLLMLIIATLSSFFSKGGAMGMGDVKIFIPIGFFLGLRLTLFALWLSFLLGGLFGVIWVFFLKKDRKAMVPFGPFICMATFFALLYGYKVLGWINY